MKPSVADADTAYQRGTLLSVDCTFSSGEGSVTGHRSSCDAARRIDWSLDYRLILWANSRTSETASLRVRSAPGIGVAALTAHTVAPAARAAATPAGESSMTRHSLGSTPSSRAAGAT